MNKWAALAVCAVAAAAVGIFAIWALVVNDDGSSKADVQAAEQGRAESRERTQAVEIYRWWERLICRHNLRAGGNEDLVPTCNVKTYQEKVTDTRKLRAGLWIVEVEDGRACFLIAPDAWRPVLAGDLDWTTGLSEQIPGIDAVSC